MSTTDAAPTTRDPNIYILYISQIILTHLYIRTFLNWLRGIIITSLVSCKDDEDVWFYHPNILHARYIPVHRWLVPKEGNVCNRHFLLGSINKKINSIWYIFLQPVVKYKFPVISTQKGSSLIFDRCIHYSLLELDCTVSLSAMATLEEVLDAAWRE